MGKEKKLDLIELYISDDSDLDGVEAISIVENPAIESDFIALSEQKEKKLQFSKVDEDKKILMGPALIPNKKIYRRIDDYEYNVFLSEETVKKASELYFKNFNQKNSTLEHREIIEGLTVVESWIVEDSKVDKSSLFGLNVPKGTWMTSIKVDNDEIWNDYVKTGKVKGFSIEAFFSSKMNMSIIDELKNKNDVLVPEEKDNVLDLDISDEEIDEILNEIRRIIEEGEM